MLMLPDALYLNYARENWTHKDENPPVGLILCAEKDMACCRYALEGLPNKVLATEYRMALPDEKVLAAELEHTCRMLAGAHDWGGAMSFRIAARDIRGYITSFLRHSSCSERIFQSKISVKYFWTTTIF